MGTLRRTGRCPGPGQVEGLAKDEVGPTLEVVLSRKKGPGLCPCPGPFPIQDFLAVERVTTCLIFNCETEALRPRSQFWYPHLPGL